MPQTATCATALKEPPDAAPAQASKHARPRTTGRHSVDQPPIRPATHCPHVPAPMQGEPDQRTTPTRGVRHRLPAPTSLPRLPQCTHAALATPHAGTARAHTSSHVPSRSPETTFSAYGSRARATLAIRSRPEHMAWDWEV